MIAHCFNISVQTPVVSFTKEVNLQSAKRPLVFNGHLAYRGLTSSLVKEATGITATGIIN